MRLVRERIDVWGFVGVDRFRVVLCVLDGWMDE